LVVPDGAGVVWAARYQGNEVRERVAGFDLTQRLLAEAAIKGYRVYFFGAGPGIAEQAKQTAEARYPGIHIVKTRDGYFTEADEAEIIEDIVSMQPHILLAALGVPKQEKWLMRNLNKLQVPVAIGVGGTLDGTVKRAPLWMQQANLEWLYRLLKQPQRAIRMLALPRFVLKVIMDKK
uniref:WecB/TagA/CpsF family glycosyltransferase n=1 Tax=Anaerospora hongkongensis TaxID=244830 RepID=UPI002FD95B9A